MRLAPLLVFVLTLIYSQEFVGSKKCKSCHKKESSGAQYSLWEKSKHAHAFETLKTPEALETAKKLGITSNPWETPACVRCHTTGFGQGGYEIKDPGFWLQVTAKGKPTKEVKRMEALKGIGCEVCHGPGSEYKSKKIMKKLFFGELPADTLGFKIPTEALCRQCHNKESPSFKEFHFEERYKEISHPYPKGYREEKLHDKN